MPQHEFDITIGRDGEVELHVKGIKGGGHDELLAGLKTEADFDGDLGEEVEFLFVGPLQGGGVTGNGHKDVPFW